MTLKVGLAGYGRRGRSHANAVAQIEGARVNAVSDPLEAARASASVEMGDVATYTTVSAMVDSGDVDAVIVAAPAHLNHDVAAEAIAHGIPVMIEKPPALSVAGVTELKEVAERSGSNVMVAFNRRFNPYIRAGIEVITDTGRLRQIVAEFHKDIREFTESGRFSSTIFDLMLLESPIHSIDLVTYLADAEVKSVHSVVRRAVSRYRDVHAALIEFENDLVCQFTSAYTAGGRLERYELHGDYVSVYLEGVNRGWILRDGDRLELKVAESAENDTVAQARCFVESVIAGSDYPHPAANLDTSIATLQLCEYIIKGMD